MSYRVMPKLYVPLVAMIAIPQCIVHGMPCVGNADVFLALRCSRLFIACAVVPVVVEHVARRCRVGPTARAAGVLAPQRRGVAPVSRQVLVRGVGQEHHLGHCLTRYGVQHAGLWADD